MRASILLALAVMGESFNHQAAERAPIHLGKVPNKKKRLRAMSDREYKRCFVAKPSKPHKERNKKGRP